MFRLISLRLLESYFRHRWLYLIPIVLMASAAVVFVMLSKPKYMAQGVLFVQKQSLLAKLSSVTGNDVTWQTPAALTVGELNELIQTDSFLRAVIQQTNLESKMGGGQEAVRTTIDNVRKSVWASTIGDNQVLIGATNETPQLAFQLANAMVNTYVQWKINADMSESDAASKFFTDLSIRYNANVEQARKELYDYLTQHPEPIKGNRPPIEALEIAKLQAALTSAENRYASALDKVENAQLAAAQTESDVRQSYIMLDAPLQPDKSTISRKALAIQATVFLLVGVILSVIGLAGSAFLDRTFRFPVDVMHGLDLKVLAMVPDMTPRPQKKKRARKPARDTIGVADGKTVVLPDFIGFESLPPEMEGFNLLLLASVPEITTVSPAKKLKPARKRKATALQINQANPGRNESYASTPKSRADSDAGNLLKTTEK